MGVLSIFGGASSNSPPRSKILMHPSINSNHTLIYVKPLPACFLCTPPFETSSNLRPTSNSPFSLYVKPPKPTPLFFLLPAFSLPSSLFSFSLSPFSFLSSSSFLPLLFLFCVLLFSSCLRPPPPHCQMTCLRRCSTFFFNSPPFRGIGPTVLVLFGLAPLNETPFKKKCVFLNNFFIFCSCKFFHVELVLVHVCIFSFIPEMR